MSWFTTTFGAILNFVIEVFRGRTGVVVNNLRSIAFAIVKDLMSADMTGEEKRRVAYQRIVAAAMGAGLQYADHAINLLIELCVANIKNQSIEKIFAEGMMFAKEAGSEVYEGVNKAVTAETAIGDDLKFANAVQILTVKLKNAGIKATKNGLNLLIEAALSATKE